MQALQPCGMACDEQPAAQAWGGWLQVTGVQTPAQSDMEAQGGKSQ
jgi:hypothetical protein